MGKISQLLIEQRCVICNSEIIEPDLFADHVCCAQCNTEYEEVMEAIADEQDKLRKIEERMD